MRITIVQIGKTEKGFFAEGYEEFLKRLKRYVVVEVVTLPEVKGKLSPGELMAREMELFQPLLAKADQVWLLDERGKEYSSVDFAKALQQSMNASVRHWAFVIGGAYGFDERLKKQHPQALSLSKMTFNHQMVRMFFAEQLYRAFSILNNEPYHNE